MGLLGKVLKEVGSQSRSAGDSKVAGDVKDTVAAPPTGVKQVPEAPGGKPPGPGKAPDSKTPDSKKDDAKAPDAKKSTENSELRVTDSVQVSDDGGKTGVAGPKMGVDYHLYIIVTNTGELPSGPFVVKFEVTGSTDWEDVYEYKDKVGLKRGDKHKAVVKFGQFPKGDYRVAACIYADLDSDDPIDCAGELGFPVRP